MLDAGCGTGRVAIELARRGYEVVGVDADRTMLDHARNKAPELSWLHGDLASIVVAGETGERRCFDAAIAAGNVMIFLEPGTEAAVVANLAAHLRPGGALVAGFQLSDGYLQLHIFDALAERHGLTLESRWATWEGAAYAGGDYAVSVHRKLTAG